MLKSRLTTSSYDGNGNGNKGLMSITMVLHVHYNSLYISLPPSAKREMSNSALAEERELRRLIF